MDIKINDRKEEIEVVRMACNIVGIGLDYKSTMLLLETIKNKDAIVETYKKKYQKEKKMKMVGFGVGGLGILLGLFVL